MLITAEGKNKTEKTYFNSFREQHGTSEPIFVTKNGYGDMVIMSMETFENTISRASMYDSLERSEQQIKDGKVKDARESLSSLRAKYGL